MLCYLYSKSVLGVSVMVSLSMLGVVVPALSGVVNVVIVCILQLWSLSVIIGHASPEFLLISKWLISSGVE
jgi:hypothetical protein